MTRQVQRKSPSTDLEVIEHADTSRGPLEIHGDELDPDSLSDWDGHRPHVVGVVGVVAGVLGGGQLA